MHLPQICATSLHSCIPWLRAGCLPVPGYTLTPDVDRAGDTMAQVSGNLFDIAVSCNNDCACKAFNNKGFLKKEGGGTGQQAGMCFYVRSQLPLSCTSVVSPCELSSSALLHVLLLL